MTIQQFQKQFYNLVLRFYRHLPVIYVTENFRVAKAQIFFHFVRSFSIRFKRDLSTLLMHSITMHMQITEQEKSNLRGQL